MSDWNHRQLGDLLDEVHGLELSDPSSVSHPSTVELETYLKEELTPFMQASVDKHLESCERCVAYLAEAYEREESRPSAGLLPFVQRVRSTASPWLAAAAMWLVAIPAGVWISSHFLAEPVVIQTRVDEEPRGLTSDAEAVSVGNVKGAGPVEGTYVLTQAQMDAWAEKIKNGVAAEISEPRTVRVDRSATQLAALSREERLGLIQPFLDEFVRLASQQLAEQAPQQFRNEIRLVFEELRKESLGSGSTVSAAEVSGSADRRNRPKKQEWFGE